MRDTVTMERNYTEYEILFRLGWPTVWVRMSRASLTALNVSAIPSAAIISINKWSHKSRRKRRNEHWRNKRCWRVDASRHVTECFSLLPVPKTLFVPTVCILPPSFPVSAGYRRVCVIYFNWTSFNAVWWATTGQVTYYLILIFHHFKWLFILA